MYNSAGGRVSLWGKGGGGRLAVGVSGVLAGASVEGSGGAGEPDTGQQYEGYRSERKLGRNTRI